MRARPGPGGCRQVAERAARCATQGGRRPGRCRRWRDELLEEERVAAAAVEQRGPDGRLDVAGDERVEQLAGCFPLEWVEVDDHRVVPAGRHRPPLGERLAGGGHERDPLAAEAVGDGRDHVEDERVGPVQVAQHDDDGLGPGRALDEREDGAGGLLASALRVDLAERHLEAHEVEQAVGDPADVGEVTGWTSAATALGAELGGHRERIVRGDLTGLQRLGDGPPHVGLAVGTHRPSKTTAPWRSRATAAVSSASRDLPTPASPISSTKWDRWRSTVASMAWLSTPSSVSRPTNGVCDRGAMTRRQQRLDGDPGLDRLVAALDPDRSERAVGDDSRVAA